MRGKLIGVISLLVVGIVAAVTISFLRTQSRSPGLASQMLPDGTQIIIQAVTYGTNHTFTCGSPFLVHLKNYLPGKLHRWLGDHNREQHFTADPSAIIWCSAFNPATERYSYINPDHLRIIDDHGCSFRIGSYGGGGSGPAFSVNRAYSPWFPRRQQTVVLEATFRNFPPLTFKFQNTAYAGAVNEFTPEPLPATRTLGTTNFTLTRIRGHFNKEGHWFEPRLKIAIDGEDRTKWFKPRVNYRDATGNHGYSLCPFEPTWKVEYDIFHSHEAPFAEDAILRIPDLEIPGPGKVVPLSRSEILGDLSLQFIALCGPGDFKFSNGVCIASAPYNESVGGSSFSSSSSGGPPRRVELSFRRKEPSLVIDVHNLGRSDELLLRGRDASGKFFPVTFNGSADRTYRYELQPGTNAARFALELIREKPGRVEYTVAPPRPEKK